MLSPRGAAGGCNIVRTQRKHRTPITASASLPPQAKNCSHISWSQSGRSCISGGEKGGKVQHQLKKEKKKKKQPSQHYAGAMVSWGKKHPYKKVQKYNITLSLFCSSISLDAISGLEIFLSLSYLPLSLCCSPLHGLSFLLLSSAAEGAALKGQGMLCTYIRARGCFENPQGKGEGPKQGALAEPP